MEPPGTAPGSDPFITSAFMSIVPRDGMNIRALPVGGKTLHDEKVKNLLGPLCGCAVAIWYWRRIAAQVSRRNLLIYYQCVNVSFAAGSCVLSLHAAAQMGDNQKGGYDDDKPGFLDQGQRQDKKARCNLDHLFCAKACGQCIG